MFQNNPHNVENKWKTLFDILPVGVSILSPERKVVEFNDRLGEILGITKEGLEQGQYVNRKYIHADGSVMKPEEFPSSIAIKEQRIVKPVEIGVVKEDGSIVWTRVSAAPLPFPEAICVIATTDITEQKNIEDALRKSMHESDQLNKFTIDRELKMTELKKEIEELKAKLGAAN